MCAASVGLQVNKMHKISSALTMLIWQHKEHLVCKTTTSNIPKSLDFRYTAWPEYYYVKEDG